MASVVKKLKHILTEAFPEPDQVVLDDDRGILGTIISSRFDGMESMDRINMIWDLLDARLTDKERSRIVHILAITPLEEKLHASSGGVGFLGD